MLLRVFVLVSDFGVEIGNVCYGVFIYVIL